jgi:ketosteroid isomerase-like protein
MNSILKSLPQNNEIQTVIEQVFKNWSSMNPDSNDSLYLADDKTVLFDIEPMQDIGWQSQKDRLKKGFAKLKDFTIAPNSDMRVHQHENLAWATMTWNYKITLHDGQRLEQNGRATFVLQRIKDKWLVLHDHVSLPVA